MSDQGIPDVGHDIKNTFGQDRGDEPELTSTAGAKQIILEGPKQRVVIPWTPDEIEVEVAGRRETFSTQENDLDVGTGGAPRTYRWDSMFPGQRRRGLTEGRALQGTWTAPRVLVGILDAWAGRSQRITLTVSGTDIQKRKVEVVAFPHSYSGGYGDVQYSLELRDAGDVIIDTKRRKKHHKKDGGGRGGGDDPKKHKKKGADHSGGKDGRTVTYTVKAGDTLGKIAQRFLGSVARWREIYKDNRKAIGGNPDVLTVGTVLKIQVDK